jgi:hypothetical protein
VNIAGRLFKNIFLISFSLIIGILICEIFLRVKNSIEPNYDIEMWKYSKLLKEKSKNSKINHVHQKNKSSILQNIEIKTNNYGQRDIYIDNTILDEYKRSFLIIGSSITLGWGVKSKNTFTNLLNYKANLDNNEWIFINGGVGNYNTERYINNYFENWSNLDFTDIIIHFFVNDTELLKDNEVNIFTKHTHLGVVVWKFIKSLDSLLKKENIINYYNNKFADDFEGFKIAKKEIERLNDYCIRNNINCHIVLMPDIQQLNPYKLEFINNKIISFSKKINLNYLDLTPYFEQTLKENLLNDYNDPHPNKTGHEIISKAIYNFLKH